MGGVARGPWAATCPFFLLGLALLLSQHAVCALRWSRLRQKWAFGFPQAPCRVEKLPSARSMHLTTVMLRRSLASSEPVLHLSDTPQNGVCRDLAAYNKAIGAISKATQRLETLSLLRAMKKDNFRPDVIAYGAAIHSCKADGVWTEALGLLREMQHMRLCPDIITYTAAVNACKRSAEWNLGLEFLEEAKHVELQPNVMTYNAALGTCSKAGKLMEVLLLLTDMDGLRVDPNLITYSIAITACEKCDDWSQALWLLRDMEGRRLAPDTIAYSAVISGCAKGRDWERAVALAAEMTTKRLELDMIACSALITACEKGGQWRQALSILMGMLSMSMRPNTVTFSSVISACEKGVEWQHALSLFESMEERRVQLDVIAVSAAISSCEKAERWTFALDLFARMRRRFITTDNVPISAAISACERGSSWPWAVELLGTMRHDRLSIDGLHVGTVMGALGKAQRWAHAALVMNRARMDWHTASRDEYATHVMFGMHSGSNNGTAIVWKGKALVGLQLLAVGPGLIAIMKPPGATTSAVLEALQLQLRRAGNDDQLTAVSRLDLPTSGVLCAALGNHMSAAAQCARAQFAGRLVSKEYICLCVGAYLGPVGTLGDIQSRLSQPQVANESFRVAVTPRGKEARTWYTVAGICMTANRRFLSLLAVRLGTGRTHQIRAHLASIGRPLVADVWYGPECFADDLDWCPRMFLHCRRIALRDVLGHPFVAQASLPTDLIQAFHHLGAHNVASQPPACN